MSRFIEPHSVVKTRASFALPFQQVCVDRSEFYCLWDFSDNILGSRNPGRRNVTSALCRKVESLISIPWDNVQEQMKILHSRRYFINAQVECNAEKRILNGVGKRPGSTSNNTDTGGDGSLGTSPFELIVCVYVV